jgi:hypothetical protein
MVRILEISKTGRLQNGRLEEKGREITDVARHKPTDLWTQEEYDVFIRYCLSQKTELFFR